MYCSHCGTKNDEESRFCSACGESLEHADSDLEVQESAPVQVSMESSGSGGVSAIKLGTIIAVIVAVIAVALIAIIAVGVLLPKEDIAGKNEVSQVSDSGKTDQTKERSVSAADLARQAPASIVQMDGMYTYDEMKEDIVELERYYPQLVTRSTIGTTVLGRDIDMLTLGNPSAKHNILIQSTMHSNEYIVTQTTMKTIEYYCKGYYDGASYDGRDCKQVLDTTCFYIVPMLNPDGVDIVQNGTANVTSQTTLKLLQKQSDFKDWKANANGVDLNRNFSTGWANLSNPELRQATEPGPSAWRGTAPESEPETQALIKLARAHYFDAFISYHMAGDCIYYDEPGNTAANSKAGTVLANTINDCVKRTKPEGYRLDSMLKAVENKNAKTTAYTVVQAGFNDWVQIELNKPGVTVEIGEGSQSQYERAPGLPPEGQNKATSLYEENRDTWAAVAAIYQ